MKELHQRTGDIEETCLRAAQSSQFCGLDCALAHLVADPIVTFHTHRTKPLDQVCAADVPRGLDAEDVAFDQGVSPCNPGARGQRLCSRGSYGCDVDHRKTGSE